MKFPKTAVLIYSGGLDSTVLLYHLIRGGTRVYPLGVNYGQRHSKELKAAEVIAGRFGRDFVVADLSALRPFLAGSSQTDPTVPVPHGHYAEESMKKTVVPNRNMLMLATAAAYAISIKAEALAYGAHAGDHAIYPDCRPEFAAAMKVALLLADWHKVDLVAPFVGMTKAEIVARGQVLGVPFEDTWSCYEGGALHCGKCGTCVERVEAFELARVKDPTRYAA